MKRLFSIWLVLILSVTMLIPQFSFADDIANDQVQDESAQAETEQAEPVALQDDSKDTADDAATDVTSTSDAAFDPYRIVRMVELNNNGEFLLPDSMKDTVTLSATKYGNGLLLTGTAADLTSGKIAIAKDFNFDRGSVGRISFDGLSDRGVKVTASIFLDDSETAVTSFVLKRQSGKNPWSNIGDQSLNVMEQNITGSHTISIGFTIEGIKETKKTSIALRSIEFCMCTVPVMYFNIDESLGSISAMNNSEDHSVECYGTVDLIVPDAFNNDETFRDEYNAQENLSGLELEYIRGRGNSTWSTDKKPYKVKFAKKQNLFGFGKNKHWILLANRFDNSLVRNRMTYWLGQKLGLEYTPQCVPVEVVMNGEFYGSYLLTEQIRIGEGRVEINDLEDDPQADDPFINSGGYLLSMDYTDDEANADSYFTTDQGMQLFIESPSFEDQKNPYQLEYIKAQIAKTESAIFGDGFKTSDGKSYQEYMDLSAAVDYWWVQEFSSNGDAFGSGSTYLYKKRDTKTDSGITEEKLYWGPLWDFDYVAWGDLEYEIFAPEGIDTTICPWFKRLLLDTTFVDKVKERWGVLSDLLTQITQEGGLLDRYQAQMEVSYNYDHEKYGSFADDSDGSTTAVRDYSIEINQLRNWINARAVNVDKAVQEYKLEDYTVKFILNGKVIEERTVTGGMELGKLPEAPAKKGYLFAGWCNDEEEYFDSTSEVSRDLVLHAEYISEDKAVKPTSLYFKSYDIYRPFFNDDDNDDEYAFFVDYKVLPENAITGDIKWSSSDESVATISEFGAIHLHSAGTATITGTLYNGVKQSLTLHSVPYEDIPDYIDIEDVSFDKNSLTIQSGKSAQLRYEITPTQYSEAEMLWISTNPEVADVDEFGIVTANKPGNTTILLFNSDSSIYTTCSIKVTKSTATLIKEAKARKTTLKKASALKKHKVKLTWKKSKGASGYVIYSASKKNGKYKKVAAIKKGSTLKWTSKKLRKGKTYYFKVKPYTKIGRKIYYGKWSNKKKVKVR